MSVKFILADRETPYLFPPSIQDYLPEAHLARFIVEIVDDLDLSRFSAAYSGKGSKPYHPSVLVAVLFYGYATGVFSSRRLENACKDSIAFRYICANTEPDHDTIAHFRKRFLKKLEALFVDILLVAEAMKIVKIGNISLDGTKIKANASKHKAFSWDYANKLEDQLKKEVKELMRLAKEADKDSQSEELDIQEELKRRDARLLAIAQAKKEIQKRAQIRDEHAQAKYEEKKPGGRPTKQRAGKKREGRNPYHLIQGLRLKIKST